MGDFRILYGRAIGKVNNFFVRTDGLAAVGDTTPDVTDIGLLYTGNTSLTSITYFDIRSPQGNNTQPGWFEGKELRVIFLDDSTTLVRSAQMLLPGGNYQVPTNTVIDFILHNSSWYATNIVENVASLSVTSASLGAAGVVNAAGVKSIVITSFAGSSAILRRALKGDNGDILTVIGAGGSNSLIILNSATATDTFVCTTSASSTQYQLAPNESISFIKNDTAWLEIRDVVP